MAYYPPVGQPPAYGAAPAPQVCIRGHVMASVSLADIRRNPQEGAAYSGGFVCDKCHRKFEANEMGLMHCAACRFDICNGCLFQPAPPAYSPYAQPPAGYYPPQQQSGYGYPQPGYAPCPYPPQQPGYPQQVNPPMPPQPMPQPMPQQLQGADYLIRKQRVSLRTAHGKFLSAQPSGTLEANRDEVKEWETFAVEPSRIMPGAVCFRGDHGMYVCVEPTGQVVCNRRETKEWESFVPVPMGRKRWALRSYHGKFLSIEPSGAIVANRDKPQEWETIEVRKTVHGSKSKCHQCPPGAAGLLGIGTAYIRTSHGKFLSAQPSGAIETNRPNPGQWEYFTVEPSRKRSGAVSFRGAHGMYLCAEPNGVVVCNRRESAEWESFYPQPMGPGMWALRTDHGKWLCVTPNGEIVADRDAPQGWETFTISR